MRTTKSSRKGWSKRLWAACVIAGGVVAGLAAFTGQLATIKEGVLKLLPLSPPSISLLIGDHVQFRPRAKPPAEPEVAGAPTGWIDSPVVVIVPISYSHQGANSSAGQLLSEKLTLKFGGSVTEYEWSYFVEFLSDKPCDDWLCRKGNVRPENLEPGKVSQLHETLFMQTSIPTLSWKEFIDKAMSDESPISMKIEVTATIALSSSEGTPAQTIEQACIVNVKRYRSEFSQFYRPQQDPRPVFWQPTCENSHIAK